MNHRDIIKNIFRWSASVRIIFKGLLVFIDDQRQEAIDFLAPVLRRLPALKRFFSRKNPIIRYIYKLLNTAIEAFFLVLATWFICYILMYLADIMWRLYLTTPMGSKYLALFEERAQTIIQVFELDHFYLTVEVTVASFVICFLVGAVCHFLHISYYLYHSRGFFGKLIFWGMPLTALVAFYIKFQFGFSDWEVTCIIATIPTYLLFISSFTYSQSLLPEVGEIIDIIIPTIKKTYRFIRTSIMP